MSISAVTIIKNGLKIGYPFVESILSVIDVCDEVIVSEGYSDDGTMDILQAAFDESIGVKIFQDRWPERKSGRAIAEITDKAVERASGDWIFYIQADEILHERNHELLQKIDKGTYPIKAVSFEFLHFTGSWYHVNPNPGYHKAIRMFRNNGKVFSHHDGWSFHGDVEPVLDVSQDWLPIYHYGWVFRDNISAKRKSHASLYPDLKEYQLAAENENPINMPEDNFFGEHPQFVKPLLKLNRYSPLGVPLG